MLAAVGPRLWLWRPHGGAVRRGMSPASRKGTHRNATVGQPVKRANSIDTASAAPNAMMTHPTQNHARRLSYEFFIATWAAWCC